MIIDGEEWVEVPDGLARVCPSCGDHGLPTTPPEARCRCGRQLRRCVSGSMSYRDLKMGIFDTAVSDEERAMHEEAAARKAAMERGDVIKIGDLPPPVSSYEAEISRFHREMFEQRIQALETMVKRIAAHLGIEG